MSQHCILGANVSTKSCSDWGEEPEGEIITRSRRFSNTPQGAQKLIDNLDKICQKNKFNKIILGVEATSLYALHLLEYLADSLLSKKYSLSLYYCNAKRLRNFKKSMPKKGKPDPQDCFVIAERIRLVASRLCYIPNKPYLPLQRFTRFRVHLRESIVREKNFFLLNFFLEFPSLHSSKLLSNRMAATSTYYGTTLKMLHIKHRLEVVLAIGSRFLSSVRVFTRKSVLYSPHP